MPKHVQSILYVETSDLLEKFKARSPRDTGQYIAGWELFKPRFSSSNTIASTGVRNKTPYGQYMEGGANEKEAPWYYNPSSKKKSGKLTKAIGKIWAGGLNPGHQFTIGGAIGPTLIENDGRGVKEIAQKIANAIIQGMG